MMRRTGKLYALTIISGLMTVGAGVLLTFWNEGTSQLHLWLDIVPQGFGMASFITTTLIVSILDSKRLANFTTYLIGNGGECRQGGHGCGYWR